jgi:hypothetical protein
VFLTTADAATALPTHDTVFVTPEKPHTTDSLHFNLFNYNHDCCTKYYKQSVSVVDTVITLIYEYDDSLIQMLCDCLIAVI